MSYMRKGFLIYEEMRKYFPIYCMRRPLVICDFATAPFWISLYMRKIWFSFLSVHCSSAVHPPCCTIYADSSWSNGPIPAVKSQITHTTGGGGGGPPKSKWWFVGCFCQRYWLQWEGNIPTECNSTRYSWEYLFQRSFLYHASAPIFVIFRTEKIESYRAFVCIYLHTGCSVA